MSEAVRKYDDLVAKIQSGDKVNYGEMEKVFAPAFLEIFMKRSLGKERERLKELKRQALIEQGEDIEEIDESEFEPSSDQIIRYELELLRTVSGTLGVRPSIKDLSNYVQYGIRNSNWKLVSNVLSLSQEGRLEGGTLEKLALDTLALGLECSYRKLKEQFPDIEINPKEVEKVYEVILMEGDPKKLEFVKNETGIAVPEELCQTTYETKLLQWDENSLRFIGAVAEITGVKPKKTPKVIEAFKTVPVKPARRGRLALNSDEMMSYLNDLYNIHGDPELSHIIQKRALEAGDIECFELIYKTYSPHKLPNQDIKASYSRLDEEDKLEEVAALIGITKVAPKKDTFSRVCSSVLSENNPRKGLEIVANLSEIVGFSPNLNAVSVESLSQGASRSGDIESLERLSKLGTNVDEKYVHRAGIQFLNNLVFSDSTGFKDLEKRLDNYYQLFGVKPSPEFVGAKINNLTHLLVREINSAADELKDSSGLDVYTPVHRINVKNHRKFESKASGALRRFCTRLKGIEKDNQQIPVSEEESNRLYKIGIKIVLAQGVLEDDAYFKLSEAVNLLGVPMSEESLRDALFDHISGNMKKGYWMSYNPVGLLERVSEKSGVQLKASQQMHEQLARDIVSRETPVGKGIEYLKKLTGFDSLPKDISGIARTRIVRELSNVDTSQYETLKELAGNIGEFSESERANIHEGCLKKLKEDPYMNDNRVKEVVKVSGVVLQAKDYELREMIRKYFEGGVGRTEPSKIAALVNQKLDVNQVFNRSLELIHTGCLTEARDLYRNTGQHPTEYGARTFIQKYNAADQLEIARRLKEVFGENSGVR